MGTWEIVANALRLLFSLYILLFLFRIVLTWFPQLDLNRPPYNFVAWPTEPFLRPTRKVIPTFGGVDMTPFVWLALVALAQELLIGQQGIVTMLTRLA
ncbi:YggT family protein [Gloeobacter violaceus]|uniref:Gsr2010 protein n=1 Tax=Gloeobacter violaceus (strain ATCC 29082 / PCC 7421) TaxID=251221 RepID=Q7NJ22_GLOVI|nr:YggT family protein [Gloeobacter violaceus]BAC89951.1 gsr2010 [Gloeobacter violaceus PCC 7421]